MACAPLSVLRSALSAYWSITVARSANDVVTTNVFVYLDVCPAVSWSETVCVCLPTVSRLSGSVFGTMNSPSIVIRRGAAPPAPLLTVSLGSRRRGSVRSGVSDCDCMILPSTICGTYSAAPERCAFVSAPVSTTFGAGAAGGGSISSRSSPSPRWRPGRSGACRRPRGR